MDVVHMALHGEDLDLVLPADLRDDGLEAFLDPVDPEDLPAVPGAEHEMVVDKRNGLVEPAVFVFCTHDAIIAHV